MDTGFGPSKGGKTITTGILIARCPPPPPPAIPVAAPGDGCEMVCNMAKLAMNTSPGPASLAKYMYKANVNPT